MYEFLSVPWGGTKLSYKDFEAPTGGMSYAIKLSDIPNAKKILAAGAMSRPHDGWCGFNVTYDEKQATIKWTGNAPSVKWVIRVWYV